MSRSLVPILFATVLMLPITVNAQYRGGRGGAAVQGGVIAHGGGVIARGGGVIARGGGVIARGGGAARSGFITTTPSPVPAFVGSVPAQFGRPAPFGRGFHGPIVRPPRTIIAPQPFGFGFYSPYFYSAPIYAPLGYTEPAYVTNPAPPPPTVSQNEVELSYQVGRLSQEIEQLRQEQAQRQAPPSPAVETPPTPTVLVFRDGHRIEIQNYAIIGQTLWVLDERSSTKISIADLDLPATQTENRARGVRFPLP